MKSQLIRQALTKAEAELRQARWSEQHYVTDAATAEDWLDSDPHTAYSDVRRLGLEEAAEYNMGLIHQSISRGDDRWVGITADDLIDEYVARGWDIIGKGARAKVGNACRRTAFPGYVADSGEHYIDLDDDYTGSYVVVTDAETWGSEPLSDDEIDAANECAEEWCDRNSPPGVEIEWRKARSGEAIGTYVWDNGSLQILGYSLPEPSTVWDLIQQAWGHASTVCF